MTTAYQYRTVEPASPAPAPSPATYEPHFSGELKIIWSLVVDCEHHVDSCEDKNDDFAQEINRAPRSSRRQNRALLFSPPI